MTCDDAGFLCRVPAVHLLALLYDLINIIRRIQIRKKIVCVIIRRMSDPQILRRIASSVDVKGIHGIRSAGHSANYSVFIPDGLVTCWPVQSYLSVPVSGKSRYQFLRKSII